MTRPEAMALCQQMVGRFTAAQTRTYLAEHGVHVGIKTVRMWADPEQAERHRENNKMYKRERALLERMKSLRDAGMTYAGITVLLRVDHGFDVSEDSVRYAVRRGRLGHSLRRCLKEPA